jgi:hypothetical protein
MSFNPLSWLASIRMYLYVGVLATGLGFAGGYHLRSKLEDAHQLAAVKTQVKVRDQALKNTGKNIAAQHQTSITIEKKVAQTNSNVDKVKTAAAKRVIKQQERQHEQCNVQPDHPTAGNDQAPAGRSGGGFVLDVGTVRLLDAARRGEAPSPADTTGSRDAALEAPSAVGLPALIDNDLDVVKEYHDLAIRHDALVDWVEQKILAPQAK